MDVAASASVSQRAGVRAALRGSFRALARGPGHVVYKNSAAVIKWLCQHPLGRAGVERVMRGGGRALLWAFDARAQDTPEAVQREWERVLRGIGLHPQGLQEQGLQDEAPVPPPAAVHAEPAASVPAAPARLHRIGKRPAPAADPGEAAHASSGCATCFARCTLDLTARPEDERTCDTVMSINDEMIRRLGGQMRIEERLTDEGGTRCVVRVVPSEAAAPAGAPGPVQVQAQDAAPSPAALTLPGEVPLWCDADTARGHFDSSARFYDYIMGYFEVPANRRAVRTLAPRLGERPTVLELGVGTGLGLVTLLRRLPAGGRVLAVDTSDGMIARTRERLAAHGLLSRVEFLREDAARTSLATGSVDAVYSSFLLDLLDVPKRRAILREAHRVMRAGASGSFLVMDAAPRGRLDRALSALYNAGYARWNPVWMALFDGYAPHCRPVRLHELLEEAGFTVLRKDRAYVTAFPVAIYHVVKK